MRIAILLTCHNRKQKTKNCLDSLYGAVSKRTDHQFDIYLVDDHSEDNTAELIKKQYPQIHLIYGTGFLYWAGGMRLAWKTALDSGNKYDGFLLINDDVFFFPSFWEKIEKTIQYSESVYNRQGIFVLSVKDETSGQFSYGGHKLRKKLFKHSFYQIEPTDEPQECQLTNANILYISYEVVDIIGILDTHFTHSIADFDYSLTAWEKGIPVLVCPEYGGYCSNDHPDNIFAFTIPLKTRIQNLYSIKGLALNEYLYYLRKHFKVKVIYAFFVFWMNALFPKLMRLNKS